MINLKGIKLTKKQGELFFERKAVYLFFLIKSIEEIRRIYNTNIFIKSNNLKKYSELDINTYKSSDTLFILGSGSSINELDAKEWEKIRGNDSLGFNFWLIHDFVPTYYMFELDKNPDRVNTFFELLNLRGKAYINVPFIGVYLGDERSDISRFPDYLRHNIYMSYVKIPGNEKAIFRKAIKAMNVLGLYKTNVLFSKRATIDRAILFGLKMGYKKIVLCGVDLNNTSYFFENSEYREKNLPIPKSIQVGAVHKTVDPSYGDLTIDLVIEEIKQNLLKPNNVELYIGSKKSALYPMLSCYFTE